MNQHIIMKYDPNWVYKWNIWFCLNNKEYREKAPSDLESDGWWEWYIHNEYQNRGENFDWNER